MLMLFNHICLIFPTISKGTLSFDVKRSEYSPGSALHSLLKYKHTNFIFPV